MSQIYSKDLKEKLLKVKTKLENVTKGLEDKVTDLNEKQKKWKQMDELADQICKNNREQIVWFNVCGKKFATNVATLLNTKDTLFYKIIISKRFDINKETFFDRNPRFFSILLDYLRYKKFNIKRYTPDELEDIRIEANYFEITELFDILEDKSLSIEFVNAEHSGFYFQQEEKMEIILKHLRDRDMSKGIALKPPGYILLELKNEVEFDEIEIGGYKGNTEEFYPDNGGGSTIEAGMEKDKLTYIATVPYGFGYAILPVKVTKVKARFIRIKGTGSLGISYLNLLLTNKQN
jgi:hypothetical protein